MKISKEGLARLRKLVDVVHREVFRPRMQPNIGGRRRRTMIKGLPPEVRTRIINQLMEAIDEVQGLAKKAGKRPRRGSGGVPPKFRWYQLLANLAGVLDGVLKNVNLDEIQEKMNKLKGEVDELQRTDPQASG